jgi:glycosyltransferase involved in cell wall biosynthesis
MKKMPKIGVCNPRLENKGGGEKWVLKMAKHYNATVYCKYYDPKTTFQGFEDVDVRVLKNPLDFVFSWLPRIIRMNVTAALSFALFKKPKDIDVLVCSSSPSEFIAVRNRGVIWYCHSPGRLAFDAYAEKLSKVSLFEKPFYIVPIAVFRVLDKIVSKRIGKIFANSRNIQDRIRKYLSLESEVLYSGVEDKEFKFRKYSKFFFYPSRITPFKRFEIAIEAFKIFKARNPGSPYQLKIAGFLEKNSKEDVEYSKKIEKMIEGVGELIVNPPEKLYKRLYGDCCCVIFTPKNEDFGLIPIEAASAKKACIGIKEGGLLETIIEGKTGFLVETPEEMAEKIELMTKKPHLFASMGKKARENYIKKFTWKAYFSRFDKEIKNAMQQKQ